MKISRLVAAITLAAGLSYAATAQAAPIIASGSVSLGVADWTPTSLINVGTTFEFEWSLLAGGTGHLIVVPAGPGNHDPAFVTQDITATVGTPVGFDAPWGDFAGFVTAAALSPSSDDVNRSLSVIAQGIFLPQGLLSGFSGGPMTLTFSATQTTFGGDDEVGSVSASYTIASTGKEIRVPEPATLALVGVALGSAGLLRRFRR